MKKIKKYFKLVSKNNFLVLVFIIFLFEFFLRTYQLDFKTPFGYDQVDNAWAAKNLIVNHKFPLVGMVAKADSGIFIGPAYYYLIGFFYWIFNLNPVASQMLSVISSLFTFAILFYVVKKLISKEAAIIALLLNTFNFKIMIFDGIQWPVQLLPAISLIIFYLLYRVVLGDVKKLILLAIATGIAFNLHFTAIFFPIIIVLSIPFFPRKKETIKYILFSLPFFLVWLIPNFIYSLTNKTSNSAATSYVSTYYHGFHLQRMYQILGDALIQFDPYLIFEKAKQLKIFIIPLFILAYLGKSFSTDRKKFIYLVLLWFIIPWVIFTVYSGEISDYYFIVNRFVGLMLISYFIYSVWDLKHMASKALVLIFIFAYCVYGLAQYLPYKDTGNFSVREKKAKIEVDGNRRIEFQVGVPESYLYYYYMRQKGIEVYVSKNK